jgi:hypothetical protein
MKNELLNLTLAAVCCLPFAGFAQGTYLSAPDGSPTNALIVAPGGNVGIGTSNPGSLLSLFGRNPELRITQDPAVAGGGTLRITAAGDLSNKAKIEMQSIILETTSGGGIGNYFKVSDRYSGDIAHFGSDGKVGIGTTMPQGALHVLHPTRPDAIVFGKANFDSPRMLMGQGPGSDNLDVHFFSSSKSGDASFIPMTFWTGDRERVRIDTGGNVGIGTTTPQAKLDVAGKVNCTVLELTSDRAQKSGFAPVDRRAILDQVARLPITTWHYTNDPAVTHLGPVAQDFKAAFHLGTDDKHIATVDADGVALAAIQALNDKVEALVAQVAKLEKENVRLRASETAALQKPRNLGQ